MNARAASETTKVEISKKLVLINSASSLVALGLNVTVLVWMQQYLLKRISPEEYSLLPVLYSIMMVMPLLTTVLTSALGRYITEAYAAGDTERVTKIVSTMFPILLGAGSLVALVGGVLSYYLSDVLTIAPEHLSDAKTMLALLMLSLVLKLCLAPFCVGLAVRQKFVLINLITTGGQLLRMAVMFVLLTAVSVRVLWVIVATVSAGFITDLVILSLSLRAVPFLRFRRRAVSWPIAGQLLSFGGWSTISAIAMTMRTSADVIILNKLGTPLDVTCFYLGALPLQLIKRASSSALYPLNPALIAMHATGQPERLKSVFLKGGRWALWFVLFVSVPLMVYGREILALYVGAEYKLAGVVMLLLLLIFPIGQGVCMLFPIAEATANIRKLSLCLLGMSIFNIGLTLYLVGVLKMGALGSGLGSAVTIVLFYPLVFWPLGLKIAHVGFSVWLKTTLLPGLWPATATLAVLLGLKTVVSLDNWFNVLSCVSVGCLAYVIAIWCGGLQGDDHKYLNKLYVNILAFPVVSPIVRHFIRKTN